MSDRSLPWGASCLVALLLASGAALAGPSTDPTRPPDFRAAAAAAARTQTDSPLELQAVFYAEGRRVAIINGERLRVDENVQSARVVRIERDRVALRRDGETIELELVNADVKRPAPAPALAEDEIAAPDHEALPAAPAASDEGFHR